MEIVAALRAAGCVFAEDEARLLVDAAPGPDELARMVQRRVMGEPLEQILGWAEFYGRRITVEPGVFVPRRRTEFLVQQAIGFLVQQAIGFTPAGAVVVDLCCGSGALGAAIAANLDRVELYAADVDPAATRCAAGNLAAFGGQVFTGDLYQPLPAGLRGRVDLIVANVPYVPTRAIASMPPEARDHEPRVALDGGSDGLDVARRVAEQAPEWLRPGGQLLIETSERQAPAALAVMDHAGLAARLEGDEEIGATVVIATRPVRR